MNLQDLFESQQQCPECGGPAFSDLILAEKKDACYNKVRSRYKVWPSAYASGALVQCRKKGAANWGNKSKNEDVAEDQELAEEFDLIETIIDRLAEHNGVDAEVIWEDLESLTDDELYVFAVTIPLMEDWQKVNKRDKTDGMSRKAVKAYRRENPGSKLKTAVTTKPSKLKKGGKASKRRKSYCSRSRGQMKMHSISCAKTPDKAICKARRRWNCESVDLGQGLAEAINPDITNPAFSHQQQIGDYLYVARYWSKGLKISAYDGNKLIGRADLMYHSAPFDDFADPKTTPKRIWLESEITEVNPKYQRQGIMSTMYAYAKMLGNSVKPSELRSPDAKAAWASWRQSGDAKHLTSNEGVAEGLNEMDKTQTSPGRDGDIDWTKKQIHLGPEHIIKAKDVAQHALKALDKTMKKSHAYTSKKKGVAEGFDDTVYPNATVIKSKNGRPVGEIYQDENGWGFFHYGMDGGNDFIDSREDAIQGLKDFHAENRGRRPDYTIKSVAEAFGPLPKDNQQIRLGRHTVDIERVGLNKNYISFAWNDSKGQEHYEEVPVGDLGSYDDLIKKIKQEISYQERKYTDQGVAEGDNEKIAGRYDPDEFDAMIGRLKNLAGAGPMKTVWDPVKRVYKNVPVAQQPKPQPR